jgi:hypothetical protein
MGVMSLDLKRVLRIALAGLALAACDAEGDVARDSGPDAKLPVTKVVTIQQPADPALQQLINSCASGLDRASCDAMCRRVICPFTFFPELPVYACSLSRSGPIATIIVSYDGPFACPVPPPLPVDTPAPAGTP